MSYDIENENYKKLKEDDRKFLQLNIERLKLKETPVDQLQSIDSNDELYPIVTDSPSGKAGKGQSPRKKHQFSNYDCYFSALTAYNNQSNKL